MKKSIKVMTLSLLAAGMLAGCSSESPNWKSEYLKFMKENFYGEALPYAKDFKDFEFNLREADGSLLIKGDNVALERLAEYASLFKEEKGWKLVYAATPDEDEEDQSTRFLRSFKLEGEEAGGEEAVVELPLAYTFEKEFDTDDGKRYVEVQFGNVNEDYEWTADGSFILFAGDPYEYSWPADEFEAITLGEYLSTNPVPQFAADRYQFQDGKDEEGAYALAACYTSDTEAAIKYTATLAAAPGWHVYGKVEFTNGSAYIADSPDGKYGLQYSYNEEEGYLIIVVTAANYLYSFPSAEMNAYIAANFGSQVALPAYSSATHYRYNALYGAALCFTDSETAAADYTTILSQANWHTYGEVEFSGGDKAYIADAPDGSYGIQYFYDEDCLIIVPTEANYLYEFPSAELKAFVKKEYESDEGIPAFSASHYMYNEAYHAVLCFTDNASAAEAYSAILDEANWYVFGEVEFQGGDKAFIADSPDGKYGIQYFFDEDCLIIVPTAVNYEHTFPSKELNAVAASFESEATVPALEAFYYSYNSRYNCALCYFDVLPEEADAGYSAILEAAGYHVYGYDRALEQYIADSPDGKFSLRYYFETYQEDTYFVIEICEPVYLDEFPTEEFGQFIEYYFYSEDCVPEIEADYYSMSDYGVVGAYFTSEKEDGGYGELLEAAGFTLSSYTFTDDDGVVTHYAYSPANQYSEKYLVYYSYADGALQIGINYGTSMVFLSDEISDAYINEVFDINCLAEKAFSVPAFAVASEEAYFETETYVYNDTPKAVDIYVYGATEEEATEYVTVTLPGDGWDVGESPVITGGQAKKAIPELKSIVYISWGYTDEYFNITLWFTMDPMPVTEFPAEDIAAGFAKINESYKTPAFTFSAPEGEGYTYEYQFDYNEWYSMMSLYIAYGMQGQIYDPLFVNNMSKEQFQAWMTKLSGEGWDITGIKEDEETGKLSGDITKHFDGEGQGFTAKLGASWVSSTEYGEYATIAIYYFVEKDPSQSFPAEDIAAAFTTLNVPAFTFSGPEGEGYTYVYAFDEANISALEAGYPQYCYDSLTVGNIDSTAAQAWLTALGQDGWDVSGVEQTSSGFGGTITKLVAIDEDTTLQAKLDFYFYGSDSEVEVTIYYVMSEPVEEGSPVSVLYDLDEWAFGYLDESDILGPDEDGWYYNNYVTTKYGAGEDTAECLNAVLDALTEDEDFPAYLTAMGPAEYVEDEEGNYSEIYFISEDGEVVVHMTAYISKDSGKICVSMEAAPYEVAFPEVDA